MKDKKYIVIIDDNDYKADDIRKDMRQLFPDATIKRFKYANPGLCYLREMQDEINKDVDSWLVMLDMQMPMMEGTPIKAEAGKIALHHIGHIASNVDVIIVSSEVVDDEKIKELSGDNYIGSVQYSPVVWMTPVYKKLLGME